VKPEISASDIKRASKSNKIHHRQKAELDLFGASRANEVLGYNCKGIVNHALKDFISHAWVVN